MIVTTEAIILNSMDYRESSKILRLYTKAFGKISAVAKGVRDRKNRFGAALEPMSHVTAVLYRKEHRDLHLLSQCDLIEWRRRTSGEIERMAAGMAVIELVDAVSHAEEENIPLFELLVQTLNTIENATKSPLNAFYYFEVHVLDILGFRPDLHACSTCGRILDEAELERKEGTRVSLGGLVCSACASRGSGLETVSTPAVRILQRMQESASCESVTRIAMSRRVKEEVARTLQSYLRNHVEGLRKLKSQAVFSEIL